MEELSVIEIIINAIEAATDLKAKVKGGNIETPIEYTYSRLDLIHYRLEIDIIDQDIRKVMSISDTICTTICDFGDMTKFNKCSISPSGGGFVSHSTLPFPINILYFDVTAYDNVTYIPSVTPQGTLDITDNGLYDISSKAYVDVNVEGGYPEPEGTYNVADNGVYNIKDYEFVDVDVPIPDPPSGTKNITANGQYDITDFAQVDVDVPNPSTGSITLTENGTYDVTERASAIVDVYIPPEPSGSITFTQNGTYDVAQKATAIVNTPVPQGTQNITSNGDYDVSSYASAHVNVPNPSHGSLSIDTNDTYDVTDYAQVVVDVPNPSTGTKNITANGDYDVTDFATAHVNVPSEGNPCTFSASKAKTEYYVGDTLDTDDITAAVNYNDTIKSFTHSVIDFVYDYSEVNMGVVGDYDSYVSYGAFDPKKIVISVGILPITLISISAAKTKTTYNVNDTLDTDDIVVTALYSDSSTAVVTEDSIIDTSSVNMSAAGTYPIGISYTYGADTEATAIDITVRSIAPVRKTIERAEVRVNPEKGAIYAGSGGVEGIRYGGGATINTGRHVVHFELPVGHKYYLSKAVDNPYQSIIWSTINLRTATGNVDNVHKLTNAANAVVDCTEQTKWVVYQNNGGTVPQEGIYFYYFDPEPSTPPLLMVGRPAPVDTNEED